MNLTGTTAVSENVIEVIGNAQSPPNPQEILISALFDWGLQPLLVDEAGLLQGVSKPAARIPLDVRP